MAGFFGTLKDGLNKGVATAGAHSKAMMEKAKINTAISNLENERTQLMNLLGQKVYEMYKAQASIEADESVVNFVAEIDKRLESIAGQQEELKRVEAELKLVTGNTVAATPADGVACSCGQQNSADAKFCVGCGSPVTQ